MEFVTRKQWGARPPKRGASHVSWLPGGPLYVHHTAGPPSQTIRQIQNYHMDNNDWSDIGYHFLVREDGTIYEGRPFETWGAHSPAANQYPSVSLIGTYSDKPPTDAQHRAVYEVKDYVRAGALRGHRDGWATSCPGDAAYRKVVQGPPPAPEMVSLYYYEYPAGDLKWGPYKSKAIRNARYAGTQLAHPTWALRKYSKEVPK
jgi:hypothetical protein